MHFSSLKEYLQLVLKIRSAQLIAALLFLALLWGFNDIKLNIFMPFVIVVYGINQLIAAPLNIKLAKKAIQKPALAYVIIVSSEPLFVPVICLLSLSVDASFRELVFELGLTTFIFTLLLYVVSFCAIEVLVCAFKKRKLASLQEGCND